MKIAVDLMGGDHAPASVIEAIKLFNQQFPNIYIIAYGSEVACQQLQSLTNVQTIICEDIILNEDEPVKAIRTKKEASMVKMAYAVRNGEADACISAGNTGALLAAGALIVGRIKGIQRPALAQVLPTLSGQGTMFMDLGANVDAKPEHLEQYALLGQLYAQSVRKIATPKIALLNIGTEDKKGHELARKTFDKLQAHPSINFIGNVEARELLTDSADVIITDGFTGNMVLKTIEGTAGLLMTALKSTLMKNLKTKLAATLLKDDLKEMKRLLDYSEYGGAYLLGLKNPVIKAHGSSDSYAFFNAIRQAMLMQEQQIATMIEEAVANH